MIGVDLLPWRARRRARAYRQSLQWTTALVMILFLVVHGYLQRQIASQQRVNARLSVQMEHRQARQQQLQAQAAGCCAAPLAQSLAAWFVRDYSRYGAVDGVAGSERLFGAAWPGWRWGGRRRLFGALAPYSLVGEGDLGG